MTMLERAAPAPPAHVQLIQMCAGAWVSAAVHAAARLAIADHLAEGARTVDDLAVRTGTHPGTLHRFLRTLGHLGLVTEGPGQQYSTTELGEALRTGAPGAARSTVLAFGGPAFWRPWEEMEYSLQTGRPAFDRVWGMPIFDYFAAHPELAGLFSEAMVGFHGSEPPTVADAYDFSGVGTVVDVGGATGNMLAALLTRHPALSGVLFDMPHVVGAATPLLEAHGVASRVRIETGSFFEGVPAGGDAYLLSHIIHDWTEAQCLTILGLCRAAMGPGGRLLIVEAVLPEGDTPHQGKLQDLVMLMFPGGQERTEREYEQLLAKAGFRLQRVIPTASVVSIVEAVPA